MAHFAQLDENNVVRRVVVIDNRDTSDAFGEEKEHIGQAYCERLFGGRWVQTSYNGNIRKRYAGQGMIYRTDIDAFIDPQPYPSWILDPVTVAWEAPVQKPEGNYVWDETTTSWKTVEAA